MYSSATSLIPEIAAIDDHDNVQITLTFPSGTIAAIDLNRCPILTDSDNIDGNMPCLGLLFMDMIRDWRFLELEE